jgi:hypothetical protein
MKGAREVIRKDGEGNTVEFKSIVLAARALNGHASNLIRALKGSGLYKGYYFEYKQIDIEGEILKDHPCYDIECSNKGRVRPHNSNRSGFGTKNGDYLGYHIAGIYRGVHRLVAQTFIENPEQKLTVDHIDRNPKNNNLENLRWATHKEQMNNRKDNLPISPRLD